MIKFSKEQVLLLHQLIAEETGGSIGVLSCFDTAEFPHEILRHHQHVGDTFQTTIDLLFIQLIDGVKGLELAAGMAV